MKMSITTRRRSLLLVVLILLLLSILQVEAAVAAPPRQPMKLLYVLEPGSRATTAPSIHPTNGKGYLNLFRATANLVEFDILTGNVTFATTAHPYRGFVYSQAVIMTKEDHPELSRDMLLVPVMGLANGDDSGKAGMTIGEGDTDNNPNLCGTVLESLAVSETSTSTPLTQKLACGVDNCDWFIGMEPIQDNDDCCYDPAISSGRQRIRNPTDRIIQVAIGGAPHLPCNGAEDGCQQIAYGDGDCDRDTECVTGLCGNANCDSWSFTAVTTRATLDNNGEYSFPSASPQSVLHVSPFGADDDCCIPRTFPEIDNVRISGYVRHVLTRSSLSPSTGVVVNGKYFVGSPFGLYVIQPATDSLSPPSIHSAYRSPNSATTSSRVDGNPAVSSSGDTVFFVCADRTVVAIDTSNETQPQPAPDTGLDSPGERRSPLIRWRFSLSSSPGLASVAFLNGVVVVPCRDGNGKVLALNATNGFKLWEISLAGLGIPADPEPQVMHSLGLVIFVGGDGRLHAVNVSSAALAWSSERIPVYNAAAQPQPQCQPPSLLVPDGRGLIFCMANDRRVHAFNASNRGAYLDAMKFVDQLDKWGYRMSYDKSQQLLFVVSWSSSDSEDRSRVYCLDARVPPGPTRTVTVSRTKETATAQPTPSLSQLATDTPRATESTELTESRHPTHTRTFTRTRPSPSYDTQSLPLTASSYTLPITPSGSLPSPTESLLPSQTKPTSSRSRRQSPTASDSAAGIESLSKPTPSRNTESLSLFPDCDPRMQLKLRDPQQRTTIRQLRSGRRFELFLEIKLRPENSNSNRNSNNDDDTLLQLPPVSTRFAGVIPFDDVTVTSFGADIQLVQISRPSLWTAKLMFELVSSDELSSLSISVTVKQDSFDCALLASVLNLTDTSDETVEKKSQVTSQTLTFERAFANVISADAVIAATTTSNVATMMNAMLPGGGARALTTAMRQQRNKAVMNAFTCNSPPIGDGSEYHSLNSPLQIVIGTDKGRFARGAIVGNSVLLIGTFLFHALVVVLYESVCFAGKKRQQRQFFSFRAQSALRFPGEQFIFVAILTNGQTFALVQLARFAVSDEATSGTDFLIVALGLLLFGGVYFVLVSPMFPLKRFREQTYVAPSDPPPRNRQHDSILKMARRAVLWMYSSEVDWRQRKTTPRSRKTETHNTAIANDDDHKFTLLLSADASDNNNGNGILASRRREQNNNNQQQLPKYFCRRFGEVFDGHIRGYHFATVIECAMAIVSAFLVGAAAGPGTIGCIFTRILMAVVVGITTVVSIYGVFIARWERIAGYLTGACVLASSILLLLSEASTVVANADFLVELAETAELVLVFFSSCKSFLDIFVLVTELCMEHCEVRVFGFSEHIRRANNARRRPSRMVATTIVHKK